MTVINLEQAYQKYQTSRANAIALGWQVNFLDQVRDEAYTFAQVRKYTNRQLGASQRAILAIINYTQACADLRWKEALLLHPYIYPQEEE